MTYVTACPLTCAVSETCMCTVLTSTAYDAQDLISPLQLIVHMVCCYALVCTISTKANHWSQLNYELSAFSCMLEKQSPGLRTHHHVLLTG